MKKKLVNVILCVAMAISLIACGGKETNSSSNTTSNTTSDTTSDAASEPAGNSEEVVLKVYGLGNDGGKYTQEQYEKLNEILKEKLNCTLEVNMISWADYTTKLPAILASGEDYDLIYTANWAYYKIEAPKGAFYELTPELLQTYAPKTYAEYPEAAWKQAEIDGKIYMFPNVTNEMESHGLLIRGDLRKKYNIPEIKTIDDLEAYLVAVKENETDMIGIKATESEDLETIMVMYPNDYLGSGTGVDSGFLATLDNPQDLRVPPSIPEYQEYYQTIRRWYENGYIANDILSSKTTSDDYFKIGQSAVAIVNITSASDLYKSTINANPDWEIEYVDFEGDSGILKTSYINNGMAIGRNSKNPERALQFLELVYQDEEVYNLIRYGLEGKNYEFTDDGLVAVPEGVSAEDAETRNLWMGLRIGKFERESADDIPALIELRAEYATRLYDNPLAGITYQLDSVNAEIAAVNNVVSQYEAPLTWGVVDPDEALPELLEKYNTAGIDKIEELAEKAIEEYLSTN